MKKKKHSRVVSVNLIISTVEYSEICLIIYNTMEHILKAFFLIKNRHATERHPPPIKITKKLTKKKHQ